MTRPVDVPIISKEPVAPVLRILVFKEIGEDLFRAHLLPQVRRVYGGQVTAQALTAAAVTMDKPRLPHPSHTYFTCGGTPSFPPGLRVEHLRDEHSSPSHRIVCLQEGREILAFQASYQGSRDGLVFTSEAPEIALPGELLSAFEIFQAINHPAGRFLGKTTAFGVRHVQQSLYMKADKNPPNRQQLWMRPRAAIPQGADQHVHRAPPACVIDQIMLEPIMRVLGLSWTTPGVPATSLNHAMWFHRDVDINKWLLFDDECTNVNNSRTLATTRVLTRNGVLLAEVTQQGMLRIPSHG